MCSELGFLPTGFYICWGDMPKFPVFMASLEDFFFASFSVLFMSLPSVL